MFGNHDKNDKLNGVACSVATCEYHGRNNTCHASNIKVGTEYAMDRSETFCSTYQYKPSV